MVDKNKLTVDFSKAKELFGEFLTTVAALRDPEGGCPWDLAQNHETLKRFMIEEAYEAAAEMSKDAGAELAGELGDVLLQVVLNAQVAQDDRRFSIEDVLASINQKMLRRHPHVFGNQEQREHRGIDQIKKEWQRIKASEKGADEAGVFDTRKVQKAHPASYQAVEIGKLSSTIDFDWESPDAVFEHLASETEELRVEFQKDPEKRDLSAVKEEVSDVYFTLAQLCRHLGIDPEETAQAGNDKFIRRFASVEKKAAEEGIDTRSCGSQILNRFWCEVKHSDR